MPKSLIADRPQDLMPDVPAGFSRFSFPGNQLKAQLLNRYLWDFFKNRALNAKAPYFKEYLQISDLWLAQANEPRTGIPIQQTHADELQQIYQDDEGYLSSHQVLSCAHDHGWPFPVWCWPDGFSGHATAWNWCGPYGLPSQFPNWKLPGSPFIGEKATEGWMLQGLVSDGIQEGHWMLRTTGQAPSITSPAGWVIEAFCAPFIQLRATCPSDANMMKSVVLQWKRKGDKEFSKSRQVPFIIDPDNLNERGVNSVTGQNHLVATLYKHPLYRGDIVSLRIVFADNGQANTYRLSNLFTAYDTRHPINNPIFIFSAWMQYLWSGDVEFLRAAVPRMRKALKWQQHQLNTLRFNHVRNTMVGHDGQPGYTTQPDGKKNIRFGHGIGNNYFDVCPFGFDDPYATSQYYRSLLVIAEMEEAIRQHPEWHIAGSGAFNPQQLRRHAATVKSVMNSKFWDEQKGRFIACIDSTGKKWDYGYTFLNIETITNGIATEEHARRIIEWLDGKRVIKGDTSTGQDIYSWRFGPRVSTKRNIEWYSQGWYMPEQLKFGAQVQDGGGVLGFSYFDLQARIKTAGADNAWQRLSEIMEWEKEVRDAGGYRVYYKTKGVTLQGGGTEGGIGIDFEFVESSMLPAVIPLGFMGLQPIVCALRIAPALPKAQPVMAIHGLKYCDSEMDIECSNTKVVVRLRSKGAQTIVINMPDGWRDDHNRTATAARLFAEGEYVFTKQ